MQNSFTKGFQQANKQVARNHGKSLGTGSILGTPLWIKRINKYIHTVKERSGSNLGSDLHDLNLRHTLSRYLEEKTDEMDTWKRHIDTSEPIKLCNCAYYYVSLISGDVGDQQGTVSHKNKTKQETQQTSKKPQTTNPQTGFSLPLDHIGGCFSIIGETH